MFFWNSWILWLNRRLPVWERVLRSEVRSRSVLTKLLRCYWRCVCGGGRSAEREKRGEKMTLEKNRLVEPSLEINTQLTELRHEKAGRVAHIFSSFVFKNVWLTCWPRSLWSSCETTEKLLHVVFNASLWQWDENIKHVDKLKMKTWLPLLFRCSSPLQRFSVYEIINERNAFFSPQKMRNYCA